MEKITKIREELKEFSAKREELESEILNNVHSPDAITMFQKYIRNYVPIGIRYSTTMKMIFKLMKKCYDVSREIPLLSAIVAKSTKLQANRVIEVAQCALLAGNRYYLARILDKIAHLGKNPGGKLHDFTDMELLTNSTILFMPENRMTSAAYERIAPLLSEETRNLLLLFTEDMFADAKFNVKKMDIVLRDSIVDINSDREFAVKICSGLSERYGENENQKYLHVSDYFHNYDFGRKVFAEECKNDPDYLFKCDIKAPAKLESYFPELFSRENIIPGLIKHPRCELIGWVASMHPHWLYSGETSTESGGQLRKDLMHAITINMLLVSSAISFREILGCIKYAEENNIQMKRITSKTAVRRLANKIADECVDEFAEILTKYFDDNPELYKKMNYTAISGPLSEKLQKKYADHPKLLKIIE